MRFDCIIVHMSIRRTLYPKIQSLIKSFPVIAILGPRQSGKTTLAQLSFPDYKYMNFEELDIRNYAISDPRKFLSSLSIEKGVILDEIQHAPDLLSYIQAEVDRSGQMGRFILTGSQNILLNQQISQSLAGRIAILTLLPFSLSELPVIPKKTEEMLLKGFYPPIYSREAKPVDWYANYIRTYIERDVRQIKNITDLSLFQKFLKLCAGRIGQLLNLTSLSNDCGISVHTAGAWLSLLEASYIIFRLQPHHKNFNKRLVKMPKLYFYDVGIACHLLEINSEKELFTHYLRGGLFESMVIAELMKQRYHAGLSSNLYFWRDKLGHEIDCILENSGHLTAIEIKSGETVNEDFFTSLKKWGSLSAENKEHNYVIYGGEMKQERSIGQILGWRDCSSLNSIIG